MIVLDLLTWFVLLIIRKLMLVIAYPTIIVPMALLIVGWRKLRGHMQNRKEEISQKSHTLG
ncbi:hypothetical protein [Hydrogenophaga sp. NFH-34]|uniref:hypothetical protein n=1 Tax=Hydrogenophaga sp. NFH-34 TaxID=2744446 RepID=UPI001F2B743E|nr:hypothetical protein [Hydrogenophaga sp. NFH-34]